MWKKLFAASAATVGVVGLLGGGNAFAASYTSGQNISVSGDIDVCVSKTGGYAGDVIIADIRGTNYEKQIVFSDASCVAVTNIPSSTNLKFIAPMGMSGLEYTNKSSTVTLNLSNSTTDNKYLRISGSMEQRVGAARMNIAFDANGGTGAVSVITGATIGSSVTLPKSTLVRDGYRFIGWNTKVDGTGTPYADEATIIIEEPGQIQLFAQWVVTTTTLDTGRNVNAAIKTLAAGSSASYDSNDTLIKKLQFVDTLPATVNGNTPKVNIALSGEEPVYAYWVANEGKIYINTEMDTIYAYRDSSDMFRGMQALTSLSLPTSFNTANVTNMNDMFRGMQALTSLSLPTSFNTANVTSMSGMFSGMKALISLNLPTSFNTAKVTNMIEMFNNMEALTSLILPASFNTAKVTNMYSMFYGMKALTSLSLPTSFNTANVTNMNSMFSGMQALTSLSLPTSFNTAKVTNMRQMFNNMQALTSLTLPAAFNTANVTNMNSMFYGMKALTSLSLPTSFNTANVTDMGGMFSNMEALSSLTLPASFDTANVTNMRTMFYDMKALTSLTLPASFDTAKVTNMYCMFAWMQSLTSLTLPTSFNTANVTDMGGMFVRMEALTSLTLPNTFVVNSGTTTTDIFASVNTAAKLYATDSTIRSLWPGVLGN